MEGGGEVGGQGVRWEEGQGCEVGGQGVTWGEEEDKGVRWGDKG